MALQPQSQNILESGWSNLVELAEIIEIIKELPLKDALIYLVSGLKIIDFTRDGYGRVRKIIQDKFNLEKYAFVPDKEEANLLINLKNNSNYVVISSLVPNYRYIDIIRTGLLIDYYHKHDTVENRKKVAKIKSDILKRLNGTKLCKIVNLPTTPFFEILMKYMLSLKEEGYSERNLEEVFENLVETWEQSTLMVKSSDTIGKLENFVERNIQKGSTFIILCGMRTVAKKVESVNKKIIKSGTLQENNYRYYLTRSEEGNQPRTQVLYYKQD